MVARSFSVVKSCFCFQRVMRRDQRCFLWSFFSSDCGRSSILSICCSVDDRVFPKNLSFLCCCSAGFLFLLNSDGVVLAGLIFLMVLLVVKVRSLCVDGALMETLLVNGDCGLLCVLAWWILHNRRLLLLLRWVNCCLALL